MRIYNTLTRKIEDFIPNNPEEIKMYTCGPTVYHDAHIGNLRTYIFEDVFEKTLKYIGYNVKRVMNITDVGHLEGDSDTGKDKMQEASKKEGKSVYEIADYYTKKFIEDAAKLNVPMPKITVKASSTIEQYILMIEDLLKKGYAYKAGGNVYFDTDKLSHEDFTSYQMMSGNLDNVIIGAREGVSEDKAKKNPKDFALWFTSSKFDNQEMKWDSPFGYGYPGWHIECSGIAIKYLGSKLDIHCGGVDNIFPHHSNEIAQSEGYLGDKWCNYWVHGEHLNVKEGKMSKSKGNIITVDTLIEKGFLPLSYRFMCLNSHYRSQLVFTYENLESAQNTYKKIRNRVLSLKEDGPLQEDLTLSYQERFKEALENDLNTAMGLTILNEVLRAEKLNNSSILYLVKDFDKVLSLDLDKPFDTKIHEDEIMDLIKQRDAYKNSKEFAKADEIRDNLLKKGIRLKDTRDGTTYEVL